MDTDTSPDTPKETDPQHVPYLVEEYPGAGQTYGCGPTFLDKFDSDGHSNYHQDLPFYPFSSREEWELVCFLLRSDLPMSALNKFFKLTLVCISPLLESLIKLFLPD